MEPAWKHLGGRWFWATIATAAAVVLLVLSLQAHHVVNQQSDPQEAFLYGRSMITPGADTTFRLFVRNGVEATPIVGAIASAVLRRAEPGKPRSQRPIWRGRMKTDAYGIAQVSPRVPADAPEGRYVLEVGVRSRTGRSTVKKSVTVKHSFKVMVTTDKPLYQPGQTIRIRTLTLANGDLRPAAGRSVMIRVQDSRHNTVFKTRMDASRFGIAATRFLLADQVKHGRYRVIASVGDTKSERSIKVRRYRLPRFHIKLSTGKRYYLPGDTLRGALVASYPFGKPVAGGVVKIKVANPSHPEPTKAALSGKTDSRGNFAFTIPSKSLTATGKGPKADSWVHLTATVIDPAGHKHEQSLTVTVADRVLRVAAYPEGGMPVAGVENTFFVVASYPDGRPARASVKVDGLAKTVHLSASGVARIQITPRSSQYTLSLTARDASGNEAHFRRTFHPHGPLDGLLLLRTDRAIYRVGQTARLTVISAGGDGRVLLDVVKDRRTVLVKELDMRGGRANLALDLPADLFGTLELHAYRIRSDGSFVGDTRIIQVNRPSGLRIHAELDKPVYRPGERALLKLAVQRPDGTPVQAALSIAAVDEAVYAMQAFHPGLEHVFFMLHKSLYRSLPQHPHQLGSSAMDAATKAVIGGTVPPDWGLDQHTNAKGSKVRFRSASLSHSDKRYRLDNDKEEYLGRRLSELPLALMGMFLLLITPLLLYSLWRLLRPQALDAMNEDDQHQLGRAGKWLALWWALGLYVPALGVVLLLAKENWLPYLNTAWLPPNDDGVVMMLLEVLGSVAFLCLGLQVLWLRRFRRNPASTAVPLLRKLLVTLPVAYVIAVTACVTVAIVQPPSSAQHLPQKMDYVELLAVLFVYAFGVSTALIVTLRSLQRSTSAWRRVGLIIGQGGMLSVIPGLLGAWLLLVPPLTYGDDSDVSDSLEGKGRFSKVLRDGVIAPRVRRDFPETLVWQPQVITDANGRATLPIDLADSITTWRFTTSAVSQRGELGASSWGMKVFQDFFVDLDLPEALTQHDRIQVPVVVHNYLNRTQTVKLVLKQKEWFQLHGPATRRLTIGARQVKAVHFTLTALRPGHHALQVSASGNGVADAVERQVRVTPNGQRIAQSASGPLERHRKHQFVIPSHAIAGASDLLVKIYPGAISQAVEGLEKILRMPSGCFEQTSSTAYANVLVLDYLKRTKQLAPDLEKKAKRYVSLGYQRMLSFELRTEGFSWFGSSPADRVVTAYGLMLFAHMARVHPVDPALIARTWEFLRDTQHEDGFWQRKRRNSSSSGGARSVRDTVRATAYIAWAMLEASKGKAVDKSLHSALAFLHKHLAGEQDGYTLALAANALLAGKHKGAGPVLERLANLARRDKGGVFWSSDGRGLVYSRGQVLRIETTALAVLALLKAGHAPATAQQGLAWLVAQKDPHGTWHSTQATILSLRALLQSRVTTTRLKKPIQLQVSANGRMVKELTISPDNREVLRLVSLRHLVRNGANTVSIRSTGKGLFYQVVASHHLPWPQARQVPQARQAKQSRPDNTPLDIVLRYSSHRLRSGERLSCRVTLRYNRPGAADMVLAELGIPPGFQLDRRAFKALAAAGRIERFRVTGRHVTLYLRSLRAAKPLSFVFHLRALRPVTVRTPRSQIYTYYEPTVRATASPVVLKVTR